MLSLNRKRLLKQFLDWKITLMLHWVSVLLKQLYNLDVKFKENWPKKGRTIKTSVLETVIKIFVGTYILLRKVLAYWSVKPTG